MFQRIIQDVKLKEIKKKKIWYFTRFIIILKYDKVWNQNISFHFVTIVYKPFRCVTM